MDAAPRALGGGRERGKVGRVGFAWGEVGYIAWVGGWLNKSDGMEQLGAEWCGIARVGVGWAGVDTEKGHGRVGAGVA